MSGIIIHRSHHAQQYVVIPNAIARNARLSFRARGLLMMLLSLPPEWHVTADMLAQDNPDSRNAIRAAMRELHECGYVEVHREQDEKGRWRTRIEVFDTSHAERAHPAFGVTSENSASSQVAPNAGKPAAGGAALKKKYRTSSRPRGAREEVKQPHPPWCGECDERTRQAEISGRPARCPACHPLAGNAAENGTSFEHPGYNGRHRAGDEEPA
jgi:hypothetical protein